MSWGRLFLSKSSCHSRVLRKLCAGCAFWLFIRCLPASALGGWGESVGEDLPCPGRGQRARAEGLRARPHRTVSRVKGQFYWPFLSSVKRAAWGTSSVSFQAAREAGRAAAGSESSTGVFIRNLNIKPLNLYLACKITASFTCSGNSFF